MPYQPSARFVDDFAGGHVSGRRRSPDRRPSAGTPLIVALHGGTYSSAYFDLDGFSLLDRAAEAGVPIVALDRPGYGETTPLPPGSETILNNAARLDAIIGDLHARSEDAARPVFLIGHSIGGAVALAIAARRPAWPLVGVAASGIGLCSPPAAGEAWAALPEVTMVELPPALKDGVMFGPETTYDPPMPAMSHAADAPVPRGELLDIVNGWPAVAADVLGAIMVPVHYRQGEFDRLWITDAAEVARFGALLRHAPTVDAALVPATGHCIDYHRAGAALQTEQLAFAHHCASGDRGEATRPT